MIYFLDAKEEKVLLFIDIIGFGALVRQNSDFDINDDSPHKLALNFPVFYSQIANDRYTKDYQESRKLKFLWASDTIVISTEVHNVNALFEELIYLQNQFYCGDMVFRGVITIGRLFHEDNIWGEPLVRAAEIEKKDVVLPRVIISMDEYSKLAISPDFQKYFFQDRSSDSFLTFDVFKPNIDIALNDSNKNIHSLLGVYLDMVITNYKNAPANIKYKWSWVAKQLYNTVESVCQELLDRLIIEEQKGYKFYELSEIQESLKKIL